MKRNLFDAYLRPSQTVIKIISNSISSSSAPGGEGIQFASSPKGHHLLAYNSSRIYVVNTRGPESQVERELKILRRPAATCINDKGSMLAVLLTDMQVDIYNLLESPPKRTQSIILDHSPRAIALSPCGSILAAAYEGGIEVSSLKSTALATDRRAVKCDAVDALAFSFDGTQILGTTVHSSQPNTVILTAPYYDPGSHMAEDDISALWTTSILFPNSSRDCSHAVLIQNGRQEEAGWTFTYDRSFETFRAVRIEDLRNGTTYFTGPSPTSQAKLIPCTLPAASYTGELVSAGFQGKEIWLYGVPEDLDAVADYSNNGADNGAFTGGLNRRNSGPSVRSPSRLPENSETARVPQWQILCDKLRNTFVSGFKVTELDGVNVVKWVADFGDSSLKERLLVAARGVMPPKPITEEDGIDFVDGGRLILVDFDYGLEDGKTTEISIEVGTKEPEVLEEETRDIDTEVAIVRRRTVAQKRGGPGAGSRTAVIRSSTTATRAPPPVPPLPTQASSSGTAEDTDDDPLLPRRILAVPRRVELQEADISEEAETESVLEEQEALDAPYSHLSPRSGATLRRAATAAAVNRRLHPAPAAAGPVEYRRADGRREHPHESDADNWVPPPPPYQEEDPVDLPAFLRHRVQGGQGAPPVPPVPAISAGLRGAVPQEPIARTQTAQPSLQQSARSSSGPQQTMRSQTAAPVQQRQPPLPPIPRLGTETAVQGPGSGETSRPTTSQSRSGYLDGDNIYDVSPQGSPTTTARPIVPRVPSDTRAVSNNTVASQTTEASSVSPEAPERSLPALPPVPRIQTIAASPERAHAPALDLHIPSPSLSSIMGNWSTGSPQAALPKPRPLSNAQTWSNPADTASADMYPTGYPYSAPATDLSQEDSFLQSLPPAPSADQLARLSSRAGHTPHRLSGGFQLNRVPVGSRASGEYGPRRSSLQQPPPAQTQAAPQQQYQQEYQQDYQQQSQQWSSQPQQTYQQPSYPSSSSYQPSPPLHQSQPHRFQQPPPVEDTPLIVSTPKGISGAFDPPDRRTSGRGRADLQILAPIPRHPRSSSTQAAVLRPTVDRLETIYSITSATGAPAGPSNSNPGYLIPPGPGSVRVPSLNRKQSRAERSAAKNIADAKKRGWNGRRRKGKKKKKDFDGASSAAWTDVTTTSFQSGFTGMFSAGGRGKGKSVARSESAFGGTEGGKGGRKCVIM